METTADDLLQFVQFILTQQPLSTKRQKVINSGFSAEKQDKTQGFQHFQLSFQLIPKEGGQ